jgi:hypothetical protein
MCVTTKGTRNWLHQRQLDRHGADVGDLQIHLCSIPLVRCSTAAAARFPNPPRTVATRDDDLTISDCGAVGIDLLGNAFPALSIGRDP